MILASSERIVVTHPQGHRLRRAGPASNSKGFGGSPSGRGDPHRPYLVHLLRNRRHSSLLASREPSNGVRVRWRPLLTRPNQSAVARQGHGTTLKSVPPATSGNRSPTMRPPRSSRPIRSRVMTMRAQQHGPRSGRRRVDQPPTSIPAEKPRTTGTIGQEADFMYVTRDLSEFLANL